MAEKLYAIDNSDDLVYVRHEDKHCGYISHLLADEIASYLKPFIICAVCNGVMREPCGVGTPQVFVCTQCSGDEGGNPLGTDRDLVSSLHANCPLKERGCVWEGILSEIVAHLETCGYYRVECTSGCGCVVSREEMLSHLENECTTRKIRCEVCSEFFSFGDDNMHELECCEALIGCPLRCGDNILRRNLCEHMDNLCPNTNMGCPYTSSGCCVNVEVLRKDVENHCTELKLEHLEMKTEFLLEENYALKAKSVFQQDVINNLVSFVSDPACLYYFICQTSYDSSHSWTLTGLSAVDSEWAKGPVFKFQSREFRILYKLENNCLVIGLSLTLQFAYYFRVRFCTFLMRFGTKKAKFHYEYTAEYFSDNKNQSMSVVKSYFNSNKQTERNIANIPISLLRDKAANSEGSVEFEIFFK